MTIPAINGPNGQVYQAQSGRVQALAGIEDLGMMAALPLAIQPLGWPILIAGTGLALYGIWSAKDFADSTVNSVVDAVTKPNDPANPSALAASADQISAGVKWAIVLGVGIWAINSARRK